ncbi:MAG: RAMP superfamily CRISPR-associated protein [Blastocatellia bacterium]
MQREFMATDRQWLEKALSDKDKRKSWGGWQTRFAKRSELIGSFGLVPSESTFSTLPGLSFLLRIPFVLRQPYLSKDERDFYVLDNPLRRDRVFQTPMVAATGWKGALRNTLWQLGHKEDDQVIIRLFGNARDDELGQAGRLHFYSTFFSANAGLEIINPHDRKTGVGVKRGPALMECVPQKTKGDIAALYVPFGPPDQSEPERYSEVAQDLELLAAGLHAMLTVYGFGAKTSSGFGTCEDKLIGEGMLSVRADITAPARSTGTMPQAKVVPDLPRYLEAPGRLHPDLRRPDGTLKTEEEYRLFVKARGGSYGKKDIQLYEKAKKWWDHQSQSVAPEAKSEEPPTRTSPVTHLPFLSLSDLRELSAHVARQLVSQSAI